MLPKWRCAETRLGKRHGIQTMANQVRNLSTEVPKMEAEDATTSKVSVGEGFGETSKPEKDVVKVNKN